jgi:hypothetical protein
MSDIPKSDLRRAVQAQLNGIEPARSKETRLALRRDNQRRPKERAHDQAGLAAVAPAPAPFEGPEDCAFYAFTKGISFLNDGVAYGEVIDEKLLGSEGSEFQQVVRRTRSGRTGTIPVRTDKLEKGEP